MLAPFVWIDAAWSTQVITTANFTDGEVCVVLWSVWFHPSCLSSDAHRKLARQASVHIRYIPHSCIRHGRIFSPPNPNLPPSSLVKHGIAAVLWYFFTGNKELDLPIWNSHLPFNVTSHPEKPTVSKLAIPEPSEGRIQGESGSKAPEARWRGGSFNRQTLIPRRSQIEAATRYGVKRNRAESV